jgi:hypothetical protein
MPRQRKAYGRRRWLRILRRARPGLTGTPSFFINGRQIVGAQPFAAFQKIVDGELAKVAAKK